MVAYQPPDAVVLMVGAAFRAEPLIEAARRLTETARADRIQLIALGLGQDFEDEIEELVQAIERYLREPFVKKNDTPLPMCEAAETISRIRAWLAELRERAALHLSLDTPSLGRVASTAPEIRDPYPRDLLVEAEQRVLAASDLRPRLEEVGVDDKFIAEGRKLVLKLRNAIGKRDLDAANLQLKLVRHYNKKGQLVMLLKRVVRAGKITWPNHQERAAAYHLSEIEPHERP